MECFKPSQLTGVAPITITEDRLGKAIKYASDWFAEHNRGRKLFMTPRVVDNEIQISIRRGDPFSRKPTVDEVGIDTITFREARKDAMVFCQNDEVLMLNSSQERLTTSGNGWNPELISFLLDQADAAAQFSRNFRIRNDAHFLDHVVGPAEFAAAQHWNPQVLSLLGNK